MITICSSSAPIGLWPLLIDPLYVRDKQWDSLLEVSGDRIFALSLDSRVSENEGE
jgi:hypothetical protein